LQTSGAFVSLEIAIADATVTDAMLADLNALAITMPSTPPIEQPVRQ